MKVYKYQAEESSKNLGLSEISLIMTKERETLETKQDAL